MTTSRDVLVVGGLDPSGGAGIARDVATLTSIGTGARAIVTAIAIQDDAVVARIEPVSAETVGDALRAALPGAAAVKLGMLHRAEIVAAIAPALRDAGLPVVLDPVLVASSGGSLAAADLVDALGELRDVVDLVTPNQVEAARLLDATSPMDAKAMARSLVEAGWRAALVTGGDIEGAVDAIDELATPDRATSFGARRIPGRSPRGTGCAFASLIAGRLAAGDALEAACRRAKATLTNAIRGATNARLSFEGLAMWPHAGHPFE